MKVMMDVVRNTLVLVVTLVMATSMILSSVVVQ